MLTLNSFSVLFSAVLGLSLAIPSNTCIVIVNLESIRKKGRPTDVIFLAKGIVNIILQGFLTLLGILFVSYLDFLRIKEVYSSMMVSTYFLTYYSFWLTAWLSAHYCTNITNLSCGFFIWLKRIVSKFLSQVLYLTALGTFPVSVLVTWAFNGEHHFQSAENSTKAPVFYHVNDLFFVTATFLGCILPFFISLLCLLLTFSFLVRHVWRVKNSNSGSTCPNLQAYVTALRTIFFLLFIFTTLSICQVLMFIRRSPEIADPIGVASWTLRSLSPLAESAVTFQASNKLKRLILKSLWTKIWRNTKT